MIKRYAEIIGAFVAIIGIIFFLMFFSGKDNQDQQATQSLQENIQSSVVVARLQSARVSRGTYLLDRELFENTVTSGLKFTKGGGLKSLKDKNVKFAYLIDTTNGKKVSDLASDSKGVKKTVDFTDPKGKYIAVKGVRVLIDANNDGIYTSEKDLIATLALDARPDKN